MAEASGGGGFKSFRRLKEMIRKLEKGRRHEGLRNREDDIVPTVDVRILLELYLYGPRFRYQEISKSEQQDF